jgi:hypothetical protein
MREEMIKIIISKKCKCISVKERNRILGVLNGNINT